MSDETMVTERQAVLRERAAAQNAIGAVFGRDGARLPNNWEGSITVAARMYPLPKVTRPRVVKDPHSPFAVWTMERREGAWRLAITERENTQPYPNASCGLYPTHERIAIWAELLANPTETVEADA